MISGTVYKGNELVSSCGLIGDDELFLELQNPHGKCEFCNNENGHTGKEWREVTNIEDPYCSIYCLEMSREFDRVNSKE